MPSFLFPWFLAGAAAAAIPIVLHLMRREPEPRVKFPSVRLLKRAPVELAHRRNLRELLLLALRVAALLLLAIAFARPFFTTGAASVAAGTTIVAVDTSFSMSGPGRIDRARQLARDAIARAPSGDLVGVISFDDAAALVATPSGDRALARAAVDGLAAGYGATRYRAALDAAAQALGAHRGTIVIVTDLQAGGWDAGDRVSVPAAVRVEVADVGPAPPDLAVASVRAAGTRVLATVRNTGPQPREAHVRLALDGRPAGDTTVPVAPGASADVAFEAPPRAAAAAVTVDDPGGLQADNTRYLVLDPSQHPPLLVVTSNGELSKDAFYVFHALGASAPGMEPFVVSGVSAAALSSYDEQRLRGVAAVLLLSTRGLERRGREALAAYVQGGGGLIVAAGPDVDGEVAGGVLGPTPLRIAAADDRAAARTLAPADARHPVFHPFAATSATLGLVKFHRVARIAADGCQPIARFTDGEPALLDCQAGEGRALIVASDLNDRWNDFPLHSTFLPFLHESVRYVAGARSRTAEYLVGDVPGGVPPTPGIVVMPVSPASPPGGRRIAVNVDPREADTSRISADEFQAAVARLKDEARGEAATAAIDREERQRLWQYVLVLMIGALAFEGLVASRTV